MLGCPPDAHPAMAPRIHIDPSTQELLDRYGFEDLPFDELCERLRSGEAGPEHNRIEGRVEPPSEGDVRALPPVGSDARAALFKRGQEALSRGEVGVVILAGGMATRFGGAVKAGVKALQGLSFLEVKLRDVETTAKAADTRIPVFLMTSFATDEAIRALALTAEAPSCDVSTFAQFVSLRLAPDGDLFVKEDGALSPYAPGHGDLTFALRRTGTLKRFRDAGGKILLMSNVDNLTATLDPAVIGAHLSAERAITVEVAPKERGDRGGAPARVDGKPQIVEAFRFPEGFDQDLIPVFNTNTLIFDAEAIDRDFPLSWFAVHKTVDGKPAVQFERLVGQLTAFLDTVFLRVERHGPDARFQPIKTPEDLERRRKDNLTALKARGVL